MAIEILNSTGCINHHPRHDLESILYVIIYVCTFTNGPNSLRKKDGLPICDWFDYHKQLSQIGNDKVGHMQGARQKILPGFSEYWADFAPFVLELIQTCFPLTANHPNALTYRGMVTILSCAQNVVQEPQSGHKVMVGTKRSSQAGAEDEPRSKRGRRFWSPLD